jgi:putative DNA primase/helicase
MEDQFLRSSLYQKTVNISTEVGSKAIESPYFKAITSGDPINAAFKHRNTFTFVSYCKQIFAANKMPRVLDNSDGFFRRIMPIKFKRQFLEGDKDTDPFLEDKLLKEKTEIFHWALAGLNRLLKNRRFSHSDETEDLLMEYKRLNNPVVCFCQDVCEIEGDAQSGKKDLFSVYTRYCKKYGYHAYSMENFFVNLYAAHASLRSIRPRKNNPERKPYIKGLRIKDFMQE